MHVGAAGTRWPPWREGRSCADSECGPGWAGPLLPHPTPRPPGPRAPDAIPRPRSLVLPGVRGCFVISVVWCSQEDDIRGFVRQEMSQHCGEWCPTEGLWVPSPLLPSTPSYIGAGRVPRTYWEDRQSRKWAEMGGHTEGACASGQTWGRDFPNGDTQADVGGRGVFWMCRPATC